MASVCERTYAVTVRAIPTPGTDFIGPTIAAGMTGDEGLFERKAPESLRGLAAEGEL